MTVPLVENILAQPEAIRTVAAHQFGPGQPALLRSGALLKSSARIILSGMGGSLFACIPLSYYLAERGVFASVIETSELLHSYSAALHETTVVVLVSRSGETVEVTKLSPILREKNVKIIGVTNVDGSTLAAAATECVLLNSPPDQFVAIQTYTATIVALLLLGAACCRGIDANVHRELDTLAHLLSSWIPECFESSEHWSHFLEAPLPLYLLGRGASLAAVHAGLLLFHEVAKALAIGMSAPNFRHGPVEVVDQRFRAIVIGSDPRTLELEAALAQDLEHMNATARWLGPHVPGYNLAPLCPWPDQVPQLFVPVLQAIPMQIAAYRLARSRGVTPGEFRHAPQVTLSETGFTARDPA